MRKFIFAFVIHFATGGILASAQQEPTSVDSLHLKILREKDPAIVADAWAELAVRLYPSNPDTMIVLSNRALAIIERYYPNATENDRLRFDFTRSTALNNIGYVHSLHGDVPLALEYYQKALTIKRKIRDREGEESTLNNMGLLLMDQGDLLKALDIYRETQQICIELNDQDRQATCLNNIGYIYQLQHDFSKAQEYYRASLGCRLKTKNKIGLGSGYNNLGYIFYTLNRLDSALHFHQLALKVRSEAQDIAGITNSHNNLGKVYCQLGDTALAVKHLNSAMQIAQKYNFPKYESSALVALGKIYLGQGLVDSVARIATRLEAIWKKGGTPQFAVNYADISLGLAEARGDWKEANEMLTLKIRMQDSVASQEQRMEIIRRDYATKYEKEIQDLESSRALDVERRKILQIITIFLFIALAMLSLIGVLFWRNLQSKRKLVAMELEKAHIEQEKLELELAKKSLESTGLSLRIAQSGQLVNEIDEIITQASKADTTEFERLLVNLKNKIRQTNKKDHDWATFQRQFEGIHPGYSKYLMERYPTLTPRELRLCCLMRLNIPSHEIISLLGISKDTLKSSRYRIHKKIGLPEGVPLAEFLMGNPNQSL